METFGLIIALLLWAAASVIFAGLYHQSRADLHKWRQEHAVLRERCNITRSIVMETYKRLYHTDGTFVDKRDALVTFIDLMGVHNVGSCVAELEKRPGDESLPPAA